MENTHIKLISKEGFEFIIPTEVGEYSKFMKKHIDKFRKENKIESQVENSGNSKEIVIDCKIIRSEILELVCSYLCEKKWNKKRANLLNKFNPKIMFDRQILMELLVASDVMDC